MREVDGAAPPERLLCIIPGVAAHLRINLLCLLQVLLEFGNHLAGPLLYVFILGALGCILELLHVLLVVLHHGIHVVLVQLLARLALDSGVAALLLLLQPTASNPRLSKDMIRLFFMSMFPFAVEGIY